jgi:hypothetical protein
VVMFILVGVVIRGVEGRVWLGVVCRGVFFGVYFLGVPPIYDAFCLYPLNHRSLFVLRRDLVFNKICCSKKKKKSTL